MRGANGIIPVKALLEIDHNYITASDLILFLKKIASCGQLLGRAFVIMVTLKMSKTEPMLVEC